MKRLLLPLLAALALPTAVNANVDPKVAEFCLKAADFAGCVKTMTTKSSDIPSMRLIQGKTELTGNSCPSGFAYAGAGMCRNWIKNNLNTIITIDAFGLWKAGHVDRPRWHTFYRFGDIIKAVYDPSCPDKEPNLYTSSSCSVKPPAPSLDEVRPILRGWGLNADRRAVWDRDLERVFGIPNMATNALKRKQKQIKKDIYSGSVKINCNSAVWRDKPRCN